MTIKTPDEVVAEMRQMAGVGWASLHKVNEWADALSTPAPLSRSQAMRVASLKGEPIGGDADAYLGEDQDGKKWAHTSRIAARVFAGDDGRVSPLYEHRAAHDAAHAATLSDDKVAVKLKVPTVVATAPERIWLNVSEDAEDAREPFPRDTGDDEVCWSANPSLGNAVEYVRADLATATSDTQRAIIEAAELRGYRKAQEDIGSILIKLIAAATPFLEEIRRTPGADSTMPDMLLDFAHDYMRERE